MGSNFLEPDNTTRNIVVFVVVLLGCGFFTASYFIKNNGCSKYSENLKTCTPYVCAARVMGFESKYLTHMAITLRREITGKEKDKFFDTSTCNVIETDDITKDEHVTCKYTDKTREEVVARSAILFGTAPLASDPKGTISEEKISVVRASYATRTPAQEKECVKSK